MENGVDGAFGRDPHIPVQSAHPQLTDPARTQCGFSRFSLTMKLSAPFVIRVSKRYTLPRCRLPATARNRGDAPTFRAAAHEQGLTDDDC